MTKFPFILFFTFSNCRRHFHSHNELRRRQADSAIFWYDATFFSRTSSFDCGTMHHLFTPTAPLLSIHTPSIKCEPKTDFLMLQRKIKRAREVFEAKLSRCIVYAWIIGYTFSERGKTFLLSLSRCQCFGKCFETSTSIELFATAY